MKEFLFDHVESQICATQIWSAEDLREFIRPSVHENDEALVWNQIQAAATHPEGFFSAEFRFVGVDGHSTAFCARRA